MRYLGALRSVIELAGGRTIPCDPDNVEYAAILASGVEIGTPPDEDGAPAVTISSAQMFKALALHGVLATQDVLAAIDAGVLPPDVEASVAAMPEADGIAVRAALAGGLARDSLTFASICAALGIAPADLDVVWAVAVAIAIENGGAA